MSDGDGNFWDPYCPCKVTRKNLVMTFLAMLCFALVIWTILETSFEPEEAVKSNVTEIKIPSSKLLENFSFQMSDRMMTKYKGEEMTKEEKEKRKLKDAEEAYTKFKEGIQLIERTILQFNATSNETEPICKCVCNLNVTLETAKQALADMIQTFEDEQLERTENDETCYNPVVWDKHPWQCLKEPVVEEALDEDEDETEVTPEMSTLLKSLK